MLEHNLIIERIPSLQAPLFIAGFEGWGNALGVSRGMVDYLIRTLNAEPFAHLDPDCFYRYDEHRPRVQVEDGALLDLTPPGAVFYAASREQAGRDLVLFRASEPQLRWYDFGRAVLSLCEQVQSVAVVTIGSMFDDVLHSDTMVSAMASSPDLLHALEPHRVVPVNYQGPSAVHSVVHEEAARRGLDSLGFWTHCPYYLQGTTHFGLLSHLGAILASWGGFHLDTGELDATWRDLNRQIQEVIEKNPELQKMINDLRKAKVRGSMDAASRHDNVIHLEDFLKPG